MAKGVEKVLSPVLDLGRETAGLFTGGMSGTDIAKGQAPTSEHIGEDIAGLAAGAGIAGSGLAAGGGTAAAGGGAGEGAAAPWLSNAPAGSVLAPPTPEALNLGTGYGANYITGGQGALEAIGAAQPLGLAFPTAGAPAFGGATTPSFGGASTSPGTATGVGTGGVQTAGGPLQAGGGGVVGTGTGTAPTAVTGTQGAAQGGDAISGILDSMRKNAGLIGLGISGAGLAAASKRPQIPNSDQLNQLAATGSQAAKDLIGSYRSGQLSAAQQASLDQLTQGTKNQINNYFASIGQSDSTAHMQALQQVDQQALGMKQQMLDNMLQQGLQAIGVAGGPLATIANYQMQQDKNLTEAFGNFANAVGQAFGKQAGQTPQGGTQGSTPSTGASLSGSGVGSTPTAVEH